MQCHLINYNLPSLWRNNTRTSPIWCDSWGLWSMWTLSSLRGHSILFLLFLLILWEPIPTQCLPFVTTCEVCADFCLETHEAAGAAEGMVRLSMETVGRCGELLVPAMCLFSGGESQGEWSSSCLCLRWMPLERQEAVQRIIRGWQKSIW